MIEYELIFHKQVLEQLPGPFQEFLYIGHSNAMGAIPSWRSEFAPNLVTHRKEHTVTYQGVILQ
jgi:hypothetical protein